MKKEETMRIKQNILITLILGIIILGNASVFASQIITQNVSVTIVPGIINVFSPVEGNMYQSNQVPIILNITSMNIIKDIQLIENKESESLCSKCKSFNSNMYFPNGNHFIIIRIEFNNNDYIEEEVNFSVDSKSNIYIQTLGGLKKASSKDIINYLFNYNFSVVYKNELAPEDSCSIRAKEGNASINNQNFGNINNLNFYSISSIEQGQGELYAQKNRETFSLKFKVNKIVENSDELLILDISEKKSNEKYKLEFNRISKKVKITGNNFEFQDMKITFIEGCSVRRTNFYLLEKKGNADKDINEVRKILNDNPIFIDKYQNLQLLFSKYWELYMFFKLF